VPIPGVRLFRDMKCSRNPAVQSGRRFFLAASLAVVSAVGCSNSTSDSENGKNATAVTDAVPDKIQLAPLPSQQSPDAKARKARSDDWFENVSATSGVEFAYQDGSEAGFYTLLESVGGGAATFDYDQDGDVDLFVTGGGRFEGPPVVVHGRSSALFRNDGDWRFADVTKAAGLGGADLYTHGVSVGDFNRDGFPDLVVSGYGGCRLYQNENGKRFRDVTEDAGLDCPRWSTAVAWCDFDRDGWPDLYVATYAQWTPDHRRECVHRTERGIRVRDVCGPSLFVGDRDFLWRNQGNGTFVDVAEQCGLTALRRGLGVVAGDFDEDGWPDFYIANDVDENELYYGTKDLKFESGGVLAGAALAPEGNPEGSMGVDNGDVDGDGQEDLFYANFIAEDNSLLKRVQPRMYVNVTDDYALLHVSRKWVGFGAALTDFDNDGWLDLAVANGHVLYASINGPYYQPAQLFRNQDGEDYSEITDHGGPYFSVPHAGRGLAVGDLDNNGSYDLVVVHQNEPIALLKNRRPPGRWVRVKLKGIKSNPDAIGAKVTAQLNGRLLTRWVRGGRGYLSYFDPRIIFPLGDRDTANITVKWPSGASERFIGLEQGKDHVLIEGQGQPDDGNESG